jgi:methylamine dehydrogenase accessory protein MauD
MTGGLLLARVVLAGVFGIAGLAKLADRNGTQHALGEFGVPARLMGPLAVLLPLAELAIAVGLLLTPTARGGGVAAAALLGAFIGGIGVNLSRGRQPDCHCFGQLHSAPAGPMTLLRNAALAALAGFVIWRGPGAGAPAIGRWLGNLGSIGWVMLVGGVLVAVVLTAILRLLLQLMQQNGRLLSAFDLVEARLKTVEARLGIEAPLLSEGVVPGGLAVGERAPSFTLPSLEGAAVTLDSMRGTSKPVLLVFSDPSCGPCTALLPEISRWQQVHADRAAILVVSGGSEDANRAKQTEFGVTNILIQADREVADAYRVAGTPSAVLVRPDGTIGSPVAAGAEHIRRIVEALSTAPGPARVPAGLLVGEPAPEIVLTTFDDESFSLSESNGTSTALLFWNPGCGFCQQMLDDLRGWEADPPEDAPELVLISTGSEEANRAMGLHSRLALDERFEVGRLFGAAGTPSAVLIDGDGRIASEVAVGADQVLSLLGASNVPSEPAVA